MKTKNHEPRLRALVLTAGLGTRLHPLTLFLPKPLLPVRGEPVVGHTLRQLRAAGCEAAALNLHHLPEALPRELGRRYHGLPLVYSHENEEIQGTLGALHPLREFLAGAEDVLLVNGDSLSRWPFSRLLRHHRRSGAEATLLLHRRPPEEALGGGVGLDADGRVRALRDVEAGPVARRHVFAGAHVLSRRLLERVWSEESSAGPGDIVGDLYIPLLAEGARLEAVVTRQPWHDLGTPRRYLEAHLDWHSGRGFWRRPLASWISPLAEVDPAAVVTRSAVERGAVVGREARLENSIVLEGARIAEGCRVERSILGPGARLPASTKVEGRMITRVRVGYSPGAGETVMGDLVYTPL